MIIMIISKKLCSVWSVDVVFLLATAETSPVLYSAMQSPPGYFENLLIIF